jgi:hypothetical protein
MADIPPMQVAAADPPEPVVAVTSPGQVIAVDDPVCFSLPATLHWHPTYH